VVQLCQDHARPENHRPIARYSEAEQTIGERNRAGSGARVLRSREAVDVLFARLASCVERGPPRRECTTFGRRGSSRDRYAQVAGDYSCRTRGNVSTSSPALTNARRATHTPLGRQRAVLQAPRAEGRLTGLGVGSRQDLQGYLEEFRAVLCRWMDVEARDHVEESLPNRLAITPV